MAASEGHPCKIFVGNLPFSLNQSGFGDLFRPFGTVIGVKLVEDRATGKKKGFGFVTFERPESTDAAIAKMADAEVEGRRLTVKRATYRGEKAEGAEDGQDDEAEDGTGGEAPSPGGPAPGEGLSGAAGEDDGWGTTAGKKRGGRGGGGSSFKARAKAKEAEGKLLGWGAQDDDWA